LSAAISSAATHGWSPAVGVGGPRIQDLVFGPGNVPWAMFNDEPGSSPHPRAPQVARLTRRYALVERRPVPGVPRYDSSVQLYVNQSGVGAALSTLTPAGSDGEMGTPLGIGVSAWRPGKAPSQPLVLTPNVREDVGASAAISPSGMTGVTYATYETEAKFVVDRLTGGRVVSAHEVPIPSADIPISTEVLAVGAGGFRAEWKLARAKEGLAGVETAEVAADGVFSPDVFNSWPYEPGAPRVSGGVFRSDARGDEVAIWPPTEPPFREGVEPVTEWELASKSAGGTWSSPQLIGTTGQEGANEIAVAINPTGRFTVLWTSAQSRQMMVGGAAGAQASNPMPLQRRRTGLTERFQRLALTTTGRVVAVWNTYRDSGAERLTSVEAATSTDGIHFSRPQRISPNKRPMRGCLDELLAPDRAGGALAWWSCENDGHRVNEYARYRP
jgi:hypothetical protein